MRIYIDGKPIENETKPGIEGHDEEILYISGAETREQVLKEFGFLDGARSKFKDTCFESHKGFDYLFLRVPDKDLTEPEAELMEIYIADNIMLLFYEKRPLIVETLLEILSSMDGEVCNLKEALHEFLNLLNTRHLNCMDDIENEIIDLEDALAKEEEREYVAEISALRKKLLILRRYYEAILTLMEDLEENRNGLFDEDDLHLLHFQSRKTDRLYHNTLNLRDYLTQVREAYQALLDIESNKVMKLFTVITAIFLPLTLLVGWYGMNLHMPETAFRYTYPLVILASYAIVTGLVIYFKRNRWF